MSLTRRQFAKANAAAIAASVAMNLNATARLKRSDGALPDGRLTAAHLGFDILQLSILLGLTGGLQNPFCLLLVAPVTATGPRSTRNSMTNTSRCWT